MTPTRRISPAKSKKRSKVSTRGKARGDMPAPCLPLDGLTTSNSGKPDGSQRARSADRAKRVLESDRTGNRKSTPLYAPRLIYSPLAPAQPTVVFDTYWRFAVKRQAAFYRRFAREPAPWSDDPILQQFKFTNAYRASDRVSQYLIRHVIYTGDQSAEEVFFRILLFKIFNRISTWERLAEAMGELRWDSYRFSDFDRVLTAALERGHRIYSAAYIMPSGAHASTELRKHRMHLRLIERMVGDRLPERIANARRMQDAFELLHAYPTIGTFLAYQYATDLNYSDLTSFRETEFVVPGPGARDGIRKCFRSLGGLTEADMIRFVTDRQEDEFARLGLDFRSLWGRPLQYIDCQSLFCEVDKYSRVFHPDATGLTGRTRIKQRFQPSDVPVDYWYPPKWDINARVAEDAANLSATPRPSPRRDGRNIVGGTARQAGE